MSIYQLWKGRRGGGIGAVQENKKKNESLTLNLQVSTTTK